MLATDTVIITAADALIQLHTPAVMMPHFSNFAPLEKIGHRFIVAQDGLWIEARRPWLHLVWPVAESPMQLPYGETLGKVMAFEFEDEGLQLNDLMAQFVDEATHALPNECAAWFLWNTQTLSLEYMELRPTAAGPGSVTFNRPALPDHLHLAVDIHSHGSFAPFFSETDDVDDAGEVKLSIVVGHVGTPQQAFQMRLCAHGLFIPIEADQ